MDVPSAGCGMEGYMLLKPGLKGSLETGPGVGAGPGVPGLPSIEEELVVVLGSPPVLPGRFWVRSFSSRLHLARRLENHTCKGEGVSTRVLSLCFLSVTLVLLS